jgi:hypothetical protein
VRKGSVKLVESSVRIVGVLAELVIATGRYLRSKIQDPKTSAESEESNRVQLGVRWVGSREKFSRVKSNRD